jgi:hypothetical protein
LVTFLEPNQQLTFASLLRNSKFVQECFFPMLVQIASRHYLVITIYFSLLELVPVIKKGLKLAMNEDEHCACIKDLGLKISISKI